MGIKWYQVQDQKKEGGGEEKEKEHGEKKQEQAWGTGSQSVCVQTTIIIVQQERYSSGFWNRMIGVR